MVGHQQGGVKHVVNSPARGQFKMIGYWGYLLNNFKWAETFRGQFRFLMREFQVGCV